MAAHTESHVYLTDKIRRWGGSVLTSQSLSADHKDELKKYVGQSDETSGEKRVSIPFRVVKIIHECLKKEEERPLYLHELLEGSDVYLPEYKPPPRNPELEARVEKLKAQQANREYKQMTKNVSFQSIRNADLADVSKDMKSLNRQLMNVFNFLLTVIGAFTFGYKAVEYSLPYPNMPAQMISGLIFATVVFFADLYFLIKTDV